MPEIRNPNLDSQGSGGGGGGGGDFRSLMTFTFIALALLLGFQYFNPRPNPPAPTTQTQQAQQPQSASAPAATSGGFGRTGPTSLVAQTTPAVVASSETETTVENAVYRIVFTNRGAQVKHWILKKYDDTSRKPLDLVQPQLAARFGLPLSLFTYEPGLNYELNQALYQASSTWPMQAPGTLTFHYAENGLDVVKTFRFDSSYVIGVATEVRRDGAPVRALVEWPAGLGDMEEFLPASQTRSSLPTPSQIVTSIEGKQDTVAAGKVSGNATLEAPYDYAAVSDLYFAAAFLPDAPTRATLVTLHNAVDLPSDLSNPNSQKKPDPVIGLAVGDTSGDTHLRLYAGPKQLDVLKTVRAMNADGKPAGPTLEPLIQYGWWGVIAKPLYLALRWLRNMLGGGEYSWGWAIIIFTTTFTVVMLPFRFMALRSSLKMMRVQPKVEAIKARYRHLKATDPKRADMNSEMMELYKVEGVNMYGGCLPMLPQIPLFFAYFRVLQNAVDLRQAHWFWLTDLSLPDPIYILPGLIILSMFLVQYLTPQPGIDATQRRMMAIVMPIMMGFFLLHYASGLALYWGTSNVINLVLQLVVNQSSLGKEMHAIAARRAQKKTNGGASPRVIQGRR